MLSRLRPGTSLWLARLHTSSTFPRRMPRRASKEPAIDRFDGVEGSALATSTEALAFGFAEERYLAPFGAIRRDKNPDGDAADLRLHGLEDLGPEIAEKLARDVAFQRERKEKRRQLHAGSTERASTRCIPMADGSDPTSFFVENPSADLTPVATVALGAVQDETKKSAKKKTAGKEERFSSSALKAGDFSYQPSSRSRLQRDEVDTITPSEMRPTDESSNFIDDHFFGGVLNSTDTTGRRDTSVGDEDHSTTNTVSASAIGLNEIDSQYFSGAKPVSITVDVNAEDSRRVRELSRSSTEDLNYIDEQLFRGYSSEESEENTNPPQDDGKLRRLKKKETEAAAAAEAAMAAPVPPPVPETSALAFVNKMRREGLLQSRGRVKSKEDFVSEIGVSMQQRITEASGYQLPATPDIRQSKDETAADADEAVRRVKPGGALEAKYRPKDVKALLTSEILFRLKNSILYNKNDILAINKMYGMDVTGAGHDSLPRFLPELAKLAGVAEGERLYIVHRLDKTTSGVLLLAKTEAMCKTLKDLFRRRCVDKRYWAIVRGLPEPGTGIINIPMHEATFDGRRRMTVNPDYSSSELITNKSRPRVAHAKILPAVTEYRVLKTTPGGQMSLLEVKPITGYKHQIRVHLGLGLGRPVMGDHKYSKMEFDGRPQLLPSWPLQRLNLRQSKVREIPIFLHAKHVQLPEILEGRDIWVDAPLSPHFTKVMNRLKLVPDSFVKV